MSLTATGRDLQRTVTYETTTSATRCASQSTFGRQTVSSRYRAASSSIRIHSGVAERIAAGLGAAGFPAEARSVKGVRDIAPFDAFVIGSAAYMFHWLKGATAFVKRHRAVLAERPVWLFGSGPLGTDLVDKEGCEIFEASRPKEFAELKTLIRPRGNRVFFGAWDPDAPTIGIGERFLRLMPASRAAMPAGDFRDWQAIDTWAAEIANELRSDE